MFHVDVLYGCSHRRFECHSFEVLLMTDETEKKKRIVKKKGLLIAVYYNRIVKVSGNIKVSYLSSGPA